MVEFSLKFYFPHWLFGSIVFSVDQSVWLCLSFEWQTSLLPVGHKTSSRFFFYLDFFSLSGLQFLLYFVSRLMEHWQGEVPDGEKKLLRFKIHSQCERQHRRLSVSLSVLITLSKHGDVSLFVWYNGAVGLRKELVTLTYSTHCCGNLNRVLAADRNKEEGVAPSAADCQSKTHCWVTQTSLLKSSPSILPASNKNLATTLKAFRSGKVFFHSQLTLPIGFSSTLQHTAVCH